MYTCLTDGEVQVVEARRVPGQLVVAEARDLGSLPRHNAIEQKYTSYTSNQ